MNLATRYLGLDLRNPLVASASPLSNTVHGVARLADAGQTVSVVPGPTSIVSAPTSIVTLGWALRL